MLEAIEQQVKEIICKELGVEMEKVKPDALLIEDLGTDSLGVTEIVGLVENEYNIPQAISREELGNIYKVRDLVRYTRRHVITKRVREILCEQLVLREEEVTLDSLLMKDIGADSLDFSQLIYAFQDEFDLEIPDEDVKKLLTVRNIVSYLEQVISRRKEAEEGMLVLTRRLGESLIIGDDIRVTILRVGGRQVRVGVKAPKHIQVIREELQKKTE